MKITKKKLFIIEIIALSFLLLVGVTYSLYTSDTDLTSTDIAVAEFIFNSNKTDLIELPFDSLAPGDVVTHSFSVANNLDTKVSEVAVEYQITLTTLHAVPLSYELIKDNEGIYESILTCNETSTRNAEGLLECKTTLIQMSHETAKNDNYILNISFPAVYNDVIYSNLIDYVDIEIESWQKVN